MHNLHQANTAINIENLSPKQLLGECIDLATRMLKDLITHFTEMNQMYNTPDNPLYSSGATNVNPPGSVNKNAVCQFAMGLMNYMLEPSKLDIILSKYLKNQELSSKSLAKTWLFQLRNLRNCWAHSQSIDIRLALRGFETLSLVFQALSGSLESELSQKIQFYRKTLAISQAQSFLH